MFVGFWFLGNQGNDCNFEAGICKWTFDSKGKFNWTRHKGSTGTTGTGPKFDHTFGNTGLFHVVVVVTYVLNVASVHEIFMHLNIDKYKKMVTVSRIQLSLTFIILNTSEIYNLIR